MESKAKNRFFAFYPEVQLMFSKAKDNARVVERSEKNRVESKAKNRLFIFKCMIKMWSGSFMFCNFSYIFADVNKNA